MQQGDAIRVRSTGQTGTAEWINGERVMMDVPIKLKNGQPGHLHIEHPMSNLEVIEEKKDA